MRALILQLTDEEIVAFTVPRVVDIVPPVDIFLEGSSCFGDVFKKMVTFREQICVRFPELKTFFDPSPSSTSYQDPKQKFIDMNKSDCCEWLLGIEDGSLVKNSLMPLVFKKEQSAFKEFSCGIVGAFGISQRETQNILRNKWGKTIEQVIGINPILSKEKVFYDLNATRQELQLEKIGLTFNEFGEVVVGYVDIKNYITLFLSQSGVQSAVTTPNNSIIIMDYTDGFPWLKWSRHFTGETSVRVKIIEPYNLLSTVLTVALWLGNDDYDTVQKCAAAVYEQLTQLKTIKHPVSGKEI